MHHAAHKGRDSIIGDDYNPHDEIDFPKVPDRHLTVVDTDCSDQTQRASTTAAADDFEDATKTALRERRE